MVQIHTIFGGKNPHPNWLVGGVPCSLNLDAHGASDVINQERLELVLQLIERCRTFAQQVVMERYESIGQGWVVRQHTITYKRPAFLGDMITAATWIASYASRRSLRRYVFWNATAKTLLAEAETQWVFIDMTNGKPVSVPDELQAAFPIVDADAAAVFRQLCV